MHLLLDPLLATQHGLVTRHQAWEAGLSHRQIDHLLVRGLLIAVHRGVFRDPAAPMTLDQRALAAVLASGPTATASHRLAVAMAGMRNYQCLLSEVTSGGRRRVPGIVSHRSSHPPEQTIIRGVPVTSAARTAVDVATVVSKATLAMWLQTWLSSRTLTFELLDTQMSLLKGHAGIPRLRAALDDRTLLHAEADSIPEAALGLLLGRSQLPPLTLHHVVTMPSGREYELDWSYPRWDIAFEMDGYGVHLRSLDAFDNDRHRRNELEIEGWTVLNFTRRQVERRPATVVSQVRRLLQRRGLVD
ncbi:MAG: hypothetical protein JWN62_4670 [Acidimicrobiales bacterium]|nr:hypothetical protein [Acidimicrobiales bacterium]